MRSRLSLLALEARWMPDGSPGDPPPEDPFTPTDPGLVGGGGGEDNGGDTWYGDPPSDPPPGDPGDLGGLLEEDPGAGGGPYVGP